MQFLHDIPSANLLLPVTYDAAANAHSDRYEIFS